MPDNQNPRIEEEISLVDIFVVLLRYRRLIIGLTLLALLVSVSGYFIYPGYQYRKALENTKFTAYMNVVPWPGIELLGFETEYQSPYVSPPNLLYALRKAGYTDFGYGKDYQVDLSDEALENRALFMVERLLSKNETPEGKALPAEQRLLSINSSKSKLEVVFKDMDQNRAAVFLQALFDKAKEELTVQLHKQAKAVVSTYEMLLTINNPTESVRLAITSGQQRYEMAKGLLLGQAEAIGIDGGIYVVEPQISPQGYKNAFLKNGLILVFAAFFFSVFLAFIVNYISTIKSDEDSMRKIRQALQKK